MSAEGAEEGSQGQARSAPPLGQVLVDPSPERAIEKRNCGEGLGETIYDGGIIPDEQASVALSGL